MNERTKFLLKRESGFITCKGFSKVHEKIVEILKKAKIEIPKDAFTEDSEGNKITILPTKFYKKKLLGPKEKNWNLDDYLHDDILSNGYLSELSQDFNLAFKNKSKMSHTDKFLIRNKIYDLKKDYFFPKDEKNKKPYQPKSIVFVYRFFLILYPALRDVKDLEKEGLWFESLPLKKNIKEPEIKIEPNSNKGRLAYIGFYYSFIHNEIKNFNLDVSISQDSKKITLTQYGFHDHNIERKFVGGRTIKPGQRVIFFTLIHEESGDEMQVAIYVGRSISDSRPRLCSITTTSTYDGNLMSFETLLVNKNDDNLQEYMLEIERYFFLHRYNYRLGNREIDLSALNVMKKVHVNLFKNILIGDFRIWRYNRSNKIVQSHFHVDENYKATCHSDTFDNKLYNHQTCLFYPSIIQDDTVDNRIINITCHPKTGTGILSFIMLKLPKATAKDRWLEGVVIIRGIENKTPYYSPIVFIKETKPESIELGNFDDDYFNNHPRKDISTTYNKLSVFFKKSYLRE